MKTIINNNFDPFYNLALEEYLLKKIEVVDDLFFLWRNKKCVVIGRNQNPFNEINVKYATENNIEIVRRSTGGGTVYHDLGNINFSFITSEIKDRLHNYEFFLSQIINILNKLNIETRFVPKTHIYLGNHKISGNAQTYYKNKMIHHGTLLFDVNKIHLENVLKKQPTIKTHAVASDHSTIMNLKDEIEIDITIKQLMDFIVKEIGVSNNDLMEFSEEEHNEIKKIADSKYKTWEWIFGQTPKFKIEKKEFNFEVSNYLISKCSHYETFLLGEKYDKEIISKVLQSHSDKDKIIDLLFT